MAELVKCLPYMPKDLSLSSRAHVQKLGTVAYASDLSMKEVEPDRIMRLTGQPI